VGPRSRARDLRAQGQLVGDKGIWQVVTVHWEANVVDNAATLAVASATTDEPVRVIEDSRCADANGGRVDERGDC
jgi:hypothetical protein